MGRGGGVAPPSVGQRMERSDDSGNWQHGWQITVIPQLALGPGTGVLAGSWGGDCGGRCWLGGSLVPDRVG